MGFLFLFWSFNLFNFAFFFLSFFFLISRPKSSLKREYPLEKSPFLFSEQGLACDVFGNDGIARSLLIIVDSCCEKNQFVFLLAKDQFFSYKRPLFAAKPHSFFISDTNFFFSHMFLGVFFFKDFVVRHLLLLSNY